MVRDTLSENIIKGIIATHAKHGATIVNIMSDFIEHVGEQWPMADRSFAEIREYLLSIDGIYSEKSFKGEDVWYLDSDRTNHLCKLIAKQKPWCPTRFVRPQKPFWARHSDGTISSNSSDKPIQDSCYYKDNIVYRQNRSTSKFSKHIKPMQPVIDTIKPCYDIPTMYDNVLLGDDFFLAMANIDLGFRYRLVHRIRRSGFCVSGQTISDATNHIRKATSFNGMNSIIINIGTVDILHGNALIDMRHDFDELIKACLNQNIRPIITTLAPLANCGSNAEKKQMVIAFNNWLMDKYSKIYTVIDIFAVMISPRGRILFDCYQAEAIYVSGSTQPHLLWNRIGRQRIFNKIKSSL